MNHYSDELESYALGLFESDERARIDAHVATCAACAARLSAAESAVAAMVDATLAPLERIPPLDARVLRGRRLPWAAAAAAVFALSTGVLAQQSLALHAAEATDGERVARLVHSHFAHAQFRSPAGAPIDAKVIYEPHGAWYDVVATGTQAGWYVRARTDRASAPSEPEPLSPRGAAAGTSLREHGSGREIDLLDGAGRLLGTVRL
ncbi:MAG: hypothetical protein NVSMB64_02300 [Candidatus Velthaea sp.]